MDQEKGVSSEREGSKEGGPSYRRNVRRLKEEPSLDVGETAEVLDRHEGGDEWILQRGNGGWWGR